jgi:hypothetical protein
MARDNATGCLTPNPPKSRPDHPVNRIGDLLPWSIGGANGYAPWKEALSLITCQEKLKIEQCDIFFIPDTPAC